MTMNKPIALDICCRKGGATVGLQRAGFYVIGIDIEPQPGYPGDEFFMEDGLKTLDGLASTQTLGWIRPALVWQSWPCQEGNTITNGTHKHREHGHQQFIPRARELSDRIGIPYVIEQPTASRSGLIRRDLTLCMDMFKGDMPPPWVQKHRSFELGMWNENLIPHPRRLSHPPHVGRVRGWRHGEYFDGPYVAAYGKGGGKGSAEEIAHAMQIDWMTDRFDLCEAIPPAYSEYIGRAFLASVDRQRMAA